MCVRFDGYRALIVDFNVRRMKAISRKKPVQWKDAMTTEDKGIIEALIHLTAQSFDLPDLRWLPAEIIDFIREHGFAQIFGKRWINEALESCRPRRPFK